MKKGIAERCGSRESSHRLLRREVGDRGRKRRGLTVLNKYKNEVGTGKLRRGVTFSKDKYQWGILDRFGGERHEN